MKHVKSTEDDPVYVKDYFEIRGFTTNKYKSSLHSILAQPMALIANAIRDHVYLPKCIVLVMDADVITETGLHKDEAMDSF